MEYDKFTNILKVKKYMFLRTNSKESFDNIIRSFISKSKNIEIESNWIIQIDNVKKEEREHLYSFQRKDLVIYSIGTGAFGLKSIIIEPKSTYTKLLKEEYVLENELSKMNLRI